MIKSVIKFLSSFFVTFPIEERKSELSGKLEILYTNGKYVLDTSHVNYSFGGLHIVFQRAFGQYGIKQREIKNVLILGFGAGSVASILEKEYEKKTEIIGVEKDHVVIELAKKYFSLDQYKQLTLHCGDAYDFVQNSSLPSFDLVVVDIFVGRIVPEKFLDELFLSALGKILAPSGILFYNFIIRDEKTRDKGAQLYKQMNSLVGHTEWVRIFARRTENWVFVSQKQKPSK